MKQLNWYQIFGAEDIPDGKTVLPTDDVQTLLKCAGIRNKPYTTLTELLADSTTLLNVINSNNAIDYLVRSTTFANNVCANQGAMTDIGANNYAARTLLDDTDNWLNAICSSSYFGYVLNKKNPNMTSNTTPSGTASSNDSYSSELSLGPAYKAFDGNTGSRWGSRTNVESAKYYVQYTFPQSYDFYMVVLIRVISGASCTFVVETYVNGAWVELKRASTSYSGNIIFAKKNTDRFRVRGISGNRYIGLYEMTMYGREDV